MGRVKSQAIKRTTRKLLVEHPNLFSSDFNSNKTVLKNVVQTDKKTRNSIAGYIARSKKKQTRI
jgi:ribosomal protein S17E